MSNRSSKKKAAAVAADDTKNNIFTVEKVLDKRAGKAGKDEFLIQWQGFPESESSWEPRENLQCTVMLADFEREYSKRERITRKRKASAGSDDDTDPNDKFALNGKQLRCIIGLTKGPGELHFLCRFSDDTARLLPAKEVNTRYRPFVDEYGFFLRRKMERRQKRMEEGRRKGADDEEGEEEWPSMPPGYRILSSEEQAEKMREESKMSQSPDIVDTFQPTPTDLLNDLQMASDGNLFSSFPPDSNDESGEASGISDSLLAVFDDRLDSPLACPIVVDTIPDDDDSLLFPGTSHRN